MNHATLTNGFAQKNITPVNGNKILQDTTPAATLQVLILTENDHVSTTLLSHLSKLKSVSVCRIYNDVNSLLFADVSNKAILFADADLLTKEIVEQLKHSTPQLLIVAVNNKTGFSVDVNEYVFNYLQFPLAFGDVFSLINQATIFYKTSAGNDQCKKNFVLVKSEYKLVKINLADILFIAGMKDYIKIWMKDKNAPLTTLQNLKEFEKKLPQYDFIRVHKSYIVALQHIDCIARNEIMISTYSIPVGDAFRNGLNGFIEAHS